MCTYKRIMINIFYTEKSKNVYNGKGVGNN